MSALSTQLRQVCFARGLHHPPDLEDELERCEGRDVAVVIGGRDLHDVETDQTRLVSGAAQQLQGLPGAQPAARGYLRA